MTAEELHARKGREIMRDLIALAEAQLARRLLYEFDGQIRSTIRDATNWLNRECQCWRPGIKCKEISQGDD